ncbi:MAG TPA: MarR family transcriptional regulator [Thermoleophilaceae bacterium]|jgi:DNA-binding MarR family transcriptional regulator
MAVDRMAEKSLRANPCFLLAHLGRVAKRRFADALEPTGLKGPEAFALMLLRDLGPISQQDLSERLDLDPSKLVALLNELESDGLAERRRDPCDRRRHIVEISSTGHDRLAAADRVMAEFEGEFFSGLSAGDLRELHGLLARVAQQVACDEVGASLEDAQPERAAK